MSGGVVLCFVSFSKKEMKKVKTQTIKGKTKSFYAFCHSEALPKNRNIVQPCDVSLCST
jgi:hypothetical protein